LLVWTLSGFTWFVLYHSFFFSGFLTKFHHGFWFSSALSSGFWVYWFVPLPFYTFLFLHRSFTFGFTHTHGPLWFSFTVRLRLRSAHTWFYARTRTPGWLVHGLRSHGHGTRCTGFHHSAGRHHERGLNARCCCVSYIAHFGLRLPRTRVFTHLCAQATPLSANNIGLHSKQAHRTRAAAPRTCSCALCLLLRGSFCGAPASYLRCIACAHASLILLCAYRVCHAPRTSAHLFCARALRFAPSRFSYIA